MKATPSRAGVLEFSNPDERRLLSYAGDSGLHVKTLADSSTSHIQAAYLQGNMTLVREERKSMKYTLRNADSKPRI